ncbi:MAG: hypothetical protein R3343_05860 [Nitriliruptorales bacterium]|nr:hypothetical protein [Nitriliruptorales bacterium]
MNRPKRVLALILAAESYVLMIALGVGGLTEVMGAPSPVLLFFEEAGFFFAFAGFPLVGWLILAKRPENRIGWVVLLVGGTLYNALGMMEITDRGFRSGTLSGVVVWLASVQNAWLPVLVIGLFVWFLVLFPDGTPTRSGWIVGRIALVVGVALGTARLLRPGPLDLSEDVVVDNAFGIDSLMWLDVFVPLGTLLLLACALFSFGSLVRRYRDAGPLVRKQVQWVVTPLGAFAVLFVTGVVLSEAQPDLRLPATIIIMSGFLVGFLGMAAGIGVAVFRYRLYEIDRIVSRTAGYGVVVAILVGVYAGSVLGLGAVARAITGESGDLVVALSTLLVAALFRPVAARVRDQVDRRFNRSRYDAARTVDAFAHRLRDEVDVVRLSNEVRGTVARVLAPRSVALWVREGGT